MGENLVQKVKLENLYWLSAKIVFFSFSNYILLYFFPNSLKIGFSTNFTVLYLNLQKKIRILCYYVFISPNWRLIINNNNNKLTILFLYLFHKLLF
jgi:hypothetical protein